MIIIIIIGSPWNMLDAYAQSLSQIFWEAPYEIKRVWEFPPLRIKSLLESNPQKPKLLVGRLGVACGFGCRRCALAAAQT